VFAVFVPRPSERIELVYKEDAGLFSRELENLSDVARCLSQVGGDQPIEFDHEKR
jgi:hypothetical protein